MNNLKTAFVVVVMLAVLYGVYLVLNKPEPVAVQGNGETPWIGAPKTMPDISPGTPYDPSAESAEGPPKGYLTPPGASFPGPPPELNPGPIPDYQKPADPFEPTGPHAQGSLNDREEYPDADELLEQRGRSPAPEASQSPPAGDTTESEVGEYSQPSPNGGRSIGASAFATSWEVAQQEIRDGKYRQALATLSRHYGSTDLTPEEHQQLEDTLDPLAGKVIYSTEHWLEKPYRPVNGETLRQIAEKYDVPWELLQNINGIEDPNLVPPGMELKVVRGPFRAEVDLAGNRLTLFAGNLYAGRFDIEVHEREAQLIGRFFVGARKLWPEYDANGETIDANHPDNPYGQWLVDLGSGVKLHSSSPSPITAERGCISLSPRDASDVYGILSVGSQVEIRRGLARVRNE